MITAGWPLRGGRGKKYQKFHTKNTRKTYFFPNQIYCELVREFNGEYGLRKEQGSFVPTYPGIFSVSKPYSIFNGVFYFFFFTTTTLPGILYIVFCE